MAGLGKASDTGSGWGVSPEARAQKLLKGRATSVATPASGGGGVVSSCLGLGGPGQGCSCGGPSPPVP